MRLSIRPTHFQPGSEWSKLHQLYPLPPILLSKSRRLAECSLHSSAGESLTSTLLTKPLTTQGNEQPLIIHERHRHRYEVNPKHLETLAAHGLTFVGKDDKGERMEIFELKDNPWFVGVQFHPEYLSKVLEPSRSYLGFLAVSVDCFEEAMEDLKLQPFGLQ
jgi:CTP synthase